MSLLAQLALLAVLFAVLRLLGRAYQVYAASFERMRYQRRAR